jgi:hypothetical protein
MITKEQSKIILADFPTEVLVTLYAISTYHEKYKFTSWVKDLLLKRGITLEDMKEFDTNFRGFYDELLNQEDL